MKIYNGPWALGALRWPLGVIVLAVGTVLVVILFDRPSTHDGLYGQAMPPQVVVSVAIVVALATTLTAGPALWSSAAWIARYVIRAAVYSPQTEDQRAKALTRGLRRARHRVYILDGDLHKGVFKDDGVIDAIRKAAQRLDDFWIIGGLELNDKSDSTAPTSENAMVFGVALSEKNPALCNALASIGRPVLALRWWQRQHYYVCDDAVGVHTYDNSGKPGPWWCKDATLVRAEEYVRAFKALLADPATVYVPPNGLSGAARSTPSLG